MDGRKVMPTQSNPLIKNKLLMILTFLKHKAEEKGLKPIITVAKLTDMLRSGGLTITYQQLVDLSKDPTIASSIKSINKNQIELSLGTDDASDASGLDLGGMGQAPDQSAEPVQPEEGTGDEEYNPDDFAAGDEDQGNTGNEMDDEEPIRPQQSIVTAMAKRAAARPD
jgi:hypothetical protein